MHEGRESRWSAGVDGAHAHSNRERCHGAALTPRFDSPNAEDQLGRGRTVTTAEPRAFAQEGQVRHVQPAAVACCCLFVSACRPHYGLADCCASGIPAGGSPSDRSPAALAHAVLAHVVVCYVGARFPNRRRRLSRSTRRFPSAAVHAKAATPRQHLCQRQRAARSVCLRYRFHRETVLGGC